MTNTVECPMSNRIWQPLYPAELISNKLNRSLVNGHRTSVIDLGHSTLGKKPVLLL